MKRIISLLQSAVVIVLMLTLTACSGEKAKVESVMNIDSNFIGNRSITIKYPLDTNIDSLLKAFTENNPLKESETSTFEYRGVEQDGHVFVLNIVFSSHDDYVSQVSTLTGTPVSVSVSQPQSVLVSGTRMVEDFDVADIISWMIRLSESDEATKNIKYDFSVNTVSINGSTFNTSSTIDISERKGLPINSISIETTNLKDGTYDRTITFSVPNKTYLDLTGSIDKYFSSNTSDDAQYSDWTSQGSSWEYKVIYKGIDIGQLSEYTAMLLDTDSDAMFYGDKDNSSTPLSEGLVFEENFNTFSFIADGGKSVPLEYKYALPTKTTHGDGIMLEDGSWKAVGAWQDGVYSVSVEDDVMNIRIPDGIQYAINGIRMSLDVTGENSFVRKTDFLYSKTQGMDAMLYAQDFFSKKDARIVTDEDEENLICSVICEGDVATITDQLVKCFGSGNFIAYDVKDSALALSAKTELTDYVDLAYMLNSTNANRPITYTVKSSSDENIIDLVCDGKDSTKVSENSDALVVDVEGGQGEIVYNGNIPNLGNIIVYCIIGALMLCSTIAAIIYMLYRQSRKISVKESEVLASAPSQTTTFSIAELTNLSDKANEKYRDEIDRDINMKIEADRIENLSRKLKAKEIAQLEKMIYGNDENDTDAKDDE